MEETIYVEEATYEIKAIFPFGRVVAIAGIETLLTAEEFCEALAKHGAGDWGELSEDNKRVNEFPLENGSRRFSIYRSKSGERYYVITEADRSATKFLFSQEY